MQVLLLLIVALVVIILTEVVKKYVTLRPEAITAIFSVLAIIGQSVASGKPPDIPVFLNGLYLYMAASLGYDKLLAPLVKQQE